MEKAGKKLREIKFRSDKNGGLLLVHTEEARAYTKYLENHLNIASYEACMPLDVNRLALLPRIDIRGEYFRAEWESDFALVYKDGTKGVREIVKATNLTKRAEVEKLELSRRYWASLGIMDWKIVIVG